MKRKSSSSPVLCLLVAGLFPLSGIPLRAQGPESEAPGKRRVEILEGITRYAPWDFPDRWLHELGAPAERGRLLRERMLSSVSWIHFLAFANALDWSDSEREATRSSLLQRLPGMESGKVRQNIIFLVALTDPGAVRILEGLLDGGGNLQEEDRADIRCALAALGEEPAIEWFIREFRGTEAFIGRPVFQFNDYIQEEIQEANRGTIRSYRFWEVLFRQPYFKRLSMLSRSGIYTMTARSLDSRGRDQLAARLLPAFIARWPGHPGCDDSALRLMNYAIERQDLKEIANWAQRASLLPDQDCSKTAVRILKALVDSQLSVREVDEMLAAADRGQNRDFLLYERFLKTAREDIPAAIEFFDGTARREPSGLFAQARRLAAVIEPSAALRDGVRADLTLEVIRRYPERSLKLAETPYEPEKKVTEDDYLKVLTGREREVVLRTRLERHNSIEPEPGKVARQYRLLLEHERLSELEKEAPDLEVRADLRYRRAKLFYREGDILFPVWAGQTLDWGHALNAVRFDAEGDRRLEVYANRTFALRRAYDLLASILADFPRYSGGHNVLFHMAHCYAKLLDYRPAKAADAWSLPERPPAGSPEGRLEFGHRRTGELFRRVVDEYPGSEWADESERGAAYRLKMAQILRAQREKAEKQKQPAPKKRDF